LRTLRQLLLKSVRELLVQLRNKFFHFKPKKHLTLRIDLENLKLRLENIECNSKKTAHITFSNLHQKLLLMPMTELPNTSTRLEKLKMKPLILTISRLYLISKSLPTSNLKTVELNSACLSKCGI
jgi:hypothetical protein